MSQSPQPALTVREVAAYLNVNQKTIYRMAQRGELPGFKVAGAWRVQRADLHCWISDRKQAAKPRARGQSDGSSHRGRAGRQPEVQ
jgi:excisionase family DNA binding protein